MTSTNHDIRGDWAICEDAGEWIVFCEGSEVARFDDEDEAQAFFTAHADEDEAAEEDVF